MQSNSSVYLIPDNRCIFFEYEQHSNRIPCCEDCIVAHSVAVVEAVQLGWEEYGQQSQEEEKATPLSQVVVVAAAVARSVGLS